MVTAIVLMHVERGRVNEVAGRLAEMVGISEVYSLAGRYDLAVLIRVATNEALAELVTDRLQSIEAIRDTETLISFRSFSRHDLEAMFAVGLEGAVAGR